MERQCDMQLPLPDLEQTWSKSHLWGPYDMTSSETSTTNPCIHTLVFAPRHVKLPITSRDITVLQGDWTRCALDAQVEGEHEAADGKMEDD